MGKKRKKKKLSIESDTNNSEVTWITSNNTVLSVREPFLTIIESSKSFRLNKYALQYRELGIHDFVMLGVSPEMLIVRVTQDNINGLNVSKDGSFSSSVAQELLKKYGYDIPCRIPVAFNKDNKEWVAYKRDAKAYTPRTVNRKGRK